MNGNVSHFMIILLIYQLLLTALGKQNDYCHAHHKLKRLSNNDNQMCYKNRQWFLNKSIFEWSFAQQQILTSHFPIDTEERNYVREVRNVIFSEVDPQPLRKGPTLAVTSDDVLRDILDLDLDVTSTDDFLQFVSGNRVIHGVQPVAHRYGGHQFGYWSGQLGDGRAVMLGEYVNSAGERWELQLKGSGLTPYSRRGDGRAVIRSSVREILCSEAMHALGIGTSRAASLVISDDPVIRDQFYNGNIKTECAAVVLRLAKSWLRIGSLEILTKNNEIPLLRKLVDFIIVHYFPSINSTDSDRYLVFFQEVVHQTAEMIAKWQSVGFTHGVCNTDNFSILSITIDYGPFGFLEAYDPDFVPNTSDDEARYSYQKQPDVGLFNMDKLRQALLPLLNADQSPQMNTILKGYAEQYKTKYMEIFLKKLGLTQQHTYFEDDEQMLAILLKMMKDTKADFTMTFRELSEVSLPSLLKCVDKEESIPEEYWTLPALLNHEWFKDWVKVYAKRVSSENLLETNRKNMMCNVNPRYILRNWIAQSVIAKTEKKDFMEIRNVLNILKNPFKRSALAEQKGYASIPPRWAKNLKVSCSS